MVGSAKLAWPDDPRQTVGLTLLLIEKLSADPGYATNFGHHFFYSGKKIIAGIHALTGQLIIPFVRDYKLYPSQGKHGDYVKSPFLAQSLYCPRSR